MVSKTNNLNTHTHARTRVESSVLPQSLYYTVGEEHFTCPTSYLCSEEQPYKNYLDFEKIFDFGIFFPKRLKLCWTLNIFRREKTRQEMETCHQRSSLSPSANPLRLVTLDFSDMQTYFQKNAFFPEKWKQEFSHICIVYMDTQWRDFLFLFLTNFAG